MNKQLYMVIDVNLANEYGFVPDLATELARLRHGQVFLGEDLFSDYSIKAVYGNWCLKDALIPLAK